MKQCRVRRRLEIMRAECRHRKFARLIRFEKSRLASATEFLFVDLALQFHERVQQSFRPRRTTGNVDIDWDVTIDAFERAVVVARDRGRLVQRR